MKPSIMTARSSTRRLANTIVIALAYGMLLGGCDSSQAPPPKSPETRMAGSTPIASLPAVVEGAFAISVEKGDVDDKGISEVSFGTLTVNGTEYLVQVSGTVMRASGVPREGARVRATLGSRTDQYGPPTFIITAMQRL